MIKVTFIIFIITIILLAMTFAFAPFLINRTLEHKGLSSFAVPAATSVLKGGEKNKTVPLGYRIDRLWPTWKAGPAIAVAISFEGEQAFAAQVLQPSGDWDYLIDSDSQNLYLQKGSSINLEASETGDSLEGVVTIKTDENGILFNCVDKRFMLNVSIRSFSNSGHSPINIGIANTKECNGKVRKKIEDTIRSKIKNVSRFPNLLICNYYLNFNGIKYLGKTSDDSLGVRLYLSYGSSPICS